MNAGMPAFVLLATAFAVVTGANDGGAILSMGLRARALRPAGALVTLAGGFVVAPLVFGTGVAQTFSRRLVSPAEGQGTIAFVIGLAAALGVVAALTFAGIPTSLTLAVVGGLGGAGAGAGLAVSWPAIGVVLAVGALAPIVGGATGSLLALLSRYVPAFSGVPRGMRWGLVGAYALQCLAYGANDGQKALAVFTVLAGVGAVTDDPLLLVGIGLLFGLGVVLSMRRVAGRLGRELLPVRSIHTLCAELASSAAVLGSAALGVPVSMTQSIAAGLVGAGMTESTRRVRWKATARLMLAWVITLPAVLLVALAAAACVRALG